MAQCKAHRTDGSGAQCKNGAIPGGTVCRYHGGSASQVQAKARERLAALVDPAIDKYIPLLNCGKPEVILSTAKDILDRTGYKPVERVETSTVDPEEVEALDALTDDELAVFIALKRKIAQSGGSGSPPEAPKPAED